LTISVEGMFIRGVYAAFTLYMMLIVLTWAAAYLRLDLYDRRLRWIVRLTEPLLRVVRRHVPLLGHWDISWVVALLIVFALRQITLMVLVRIVV